jgi:hypothetical protein
MSLLPRYLARITPSNIITKSYSVNVTGVGTGQGQQQQ